jgi:serine/threonine-protein kinase
MTTPSIPPQTLLAGKIRLIQRIGRGGMGDVWIARNEATQAEVAVKTLPRTERTAVHDERFRREARLAATVSHRNVVRIFDLLDEADGTLGLVMELLRGGTLENCIRERGPLSSIHAIAVIAPILSALHHVHQKGIVHRDVKPANIFFAVEPDGHVIPKILDFGIAKLPAAGSALTMDGSVLGTPHFMSPEQIRGQEDIDGRSDMFSVAVVLYEMITGVRVFQRDSAAASLAAVLEYEVDPDPRIEPRVWIAITRALAKRPYERFGTCGELADALRSAIDASEDDLQQSLQELRPKSDTLPRPAASTTTNGPSSSSQPEPRTGSSRKKTPQGSRTMMWTAGAAASAAVVAVVATLALTRGGAPARAEDVPAASGGPARTALPVSGGTGTAIATSPRDVVPPPEATPDVPSAGTATTAAAAAGSSKPSASTVPKPAAGATGTSAKPAASGTKAPAGAAVKPGKPIATSPGF